MRLALYSHRHPEEITAKQPCQEASAKLGLKASAIPASILALVMRLQAILKGATNAGAEQGRQLRHRRPHDRHLRETLPLLPRAFSADPEARAPGQVFYALYSLSPVSLLGGSLIVTPSPNTIMLVSNAGAQRTHQPAPSLHLKSKVCHEKVSPQCSLGI